MEHANEQVAATRAAAAEIEETFASAPVDFDAGCVGSVRRAAEHLGLPHQDTVSGAAHDALKVDAVTPAAMIFVPSQGGLSHNEAEWTSQGDCAAGASTLLHAILDRASAVA